MTPEQLAIVAPTVDPAQFPLRLRLYKARQSASHKLHLEADELVRSVCRIISIITTEDMHRPMPDAELQEEVDLCLRLMIVANGLQRRADREAERLYGSPADAG